jgi:hypothetical protein
MIIVTKIHTTLTAEDYLIKSAKEKGFNISEILNRALSDKLNVKEAVEKSEVHKCSVCQKEINAGYICQQNKVVICDECEKSWNYKKCNVDSDELNGNGIHYHIRFGFVKNEFGKTIKDIEKREADAQFEELR